MILRFHQAHTGRRRDRLSPGGCTSHCADTRRARGIIVVVALFLPGKLAAADQNGLPLSTRQPARSVQIAGRAAVIDGHTLWLPRLRVLVRLAGIDSCELPQWSFEPNASEAAPSPAPFACGAMAKAWLKRLVGDERVTCVLDLHFSTASVAGICRVGTVDLGREMLRVGLAELATDGSSPPDYRAAQTRAKEARYGMWGTYVLDIDEWRTHAVDQTLGRQPFADWNLLSTRQREISPAFRDARRQPSRRNR